MELGAEPVTPETAFYRPAGLGFDARGNVYVLDSGNHRVQVFDPDGELIRSFGEPGQGPGQLNEPQGMQVEADGAVWLADTGNRRIQPFDPNGEALDPIGLEYFPYDLRVAGERIFVQRMPQSDLFAGPDPSPLIQILDRSAVPLGAAVPPTPSDKGILYMLENVVSLAHTADGGFAVATTHFSSLIRTFDREGRPRGEIPVLYKTEAWAPLGRRPAEINDASLEFIARTATDLAWDPRRELLLVLAGYVDRTTEGEWITGREVYRYAVDGSYHGTVILPHSAMRIAADPDGRLWTLDVDGVARAFRITDPDRDPNSGR